MSHISQIYVQWRQRKHRRWKRYRYFIASLSFSTTIAPANRLSVSPLGNQCSRLPSRPCELVPGLGPQIQWSRAWGSTGVFLGGDGGEGVPWERAAGQMCTAGWQRVGHCHTSCPCSSLGPALCQPPLAAFLNRGVTGQDVAGVLDTAATRSFGCARNGRDTHTHTHRGLFWLSAREERKRKSRRV